MPETLSGEPLLRTLSPALRQLERSLRAWLDGPHRQPLSTIARATLEGLAIDLRRQADALDVDRPVLVVMLLGGTGVGKSTLLNALAGGAIAEASFHRPTTRDPVVYFHESLRSDRLDPALRHCRLVEHDRAALAGKVLVDTPDLDSNDLVNRERLQKVLPVADVVLYVGSQEKYHDKLGWELFRQQRKRRAFAFVLNKWDRCVRASATGLRPDQDLLRDLEEEGFHNPLLFRTCAQCWVDRSDGNGQPSVPEGEQFPDLVKWLEEGLSRLEVEAIKARGVSQLLDHVVQALAAVCPPDLGEAAEKVRAAWGRSLDEEAAATAQVLLNTLEPYQREIEHHFALEGQRRFRGMMAAYLNVLTRIVYVGSQLRERYIGGPKEREQQPPVWDLATFTRACSDTAEEGFPVGVLAPAVEAAGKVDWRTRHAMTLVEVLHAVEQEWSKPGGARRWFQTIMVWLADWVPLLVLLAALIQLLWRHFDPMQQGYAPLQWFDVALVGIVTLVTLVIMHILIILLLPIRWGSIRGEFARRLEARLREELQATYGPIPGDVADVLREERRRVEELTQQTRDVADWLRQREQAASITSLYGEDRDDE